MGGPEYSPSGTNTTHPKKSTDTDNVNPRSTRIERVTTSNNVRSNITNIMSTTNKEYKGNIKTFGSFLAKEVL